MRSGRERGIPAPDGTDVVVEVGATVAALHSVDILGGGDEGQDLDPLSTMSFLVG